MNDIIEDVKSKINIVDIISEKVSLTKKGKNFFGLCPFHQDSNPSFSVSPEKKMYKCFSCGEGGNVFTFIQKSQNLSFKESLKLLADRAGVENNINTSEYKHEYTQNNDLLISALADANEFYMTSLLSSEGKDAMSYIKKRGITPKMIEYFSIGYSPESSINKFLKIKGHEDSTIINTSLTRYDTSNFFNDRIMFGIKNKFGDIVAFSARTIKKDDDNQKYINSPTTELFEKSSILYNYSNAKRSITSSKQVYILEGFFDVISLYKIGIENSVSVMGTAFTNKHANLLKGVKVIMLLDGDGAGQIATTKSIKILVENGIEVSVIKNETKLDPDEILNQTNGAEELKKLLSEDNIFEWIDFMYDYHLNENEDVILFLNIFVSEFNKYKTYINAIEKNEKNIAIKISSKQKYFIEKISKKFNIETKLLLERFGSTVSSPRAKPTAEKVENNYLNDRFVKILIKNLVMNSSNEYIKIIKNSRIIYSNNIYHNILNKLSKAKLDEFSATDKEEINNIINNDKVELTKTTKAFKEYAEWERRKTFEEQKNILKEGIDLATDEKTKASKIELLKELTKGTRE